MLLSCRTLAHRESIGSPGESGSSGCAAPPHVPQRSTTASGAPLQLARSIGRAPARGRSCVVINRSPARGSATRRSQ
jgi:hypothetical protein